jgi:putative membrane protein
MKVITSATAALALSLGLAAGAGAQNPNPQNPASPAPSRPHGATDDVGEFIRGAGESGQAEVAFAGIAQQKSQQGTVRDHAARLERDHKAANQELMTLAKAKRVEIPALSAEHRAAQRKLEDLSGAAFDREYIGMMAKAHDASIARFSAAAKSEDADVRAFAVKTLPTLRSHMEAVEGARKAIGGTHPPK